MNLNWEYIWGALITTLVASLIKMLLNLIKEQKAKYEQEQKEKNNIIQALMKNNEELINWRKDIEQRNKLLENELKSLNEKIVLITNSDLILMKDRLIQSCKFFIIRKQITLSAREIITEMYYCYNNMGGNGSAKVLYEQVMKLPIHDMDSSEFENITYTEGDNHAK